MACHIWPTNPSIGQTETVNSITYKWTGLVWDAVVGPLKHSQLADPNVDGAHITAAIENSDGLTAQDTHDATKAILIAQGLSGNYGFFEKGFSYVNVGDVGIAGDGKIYTYVGDGSPAKVVVAGTNPVGDSDYNELSFKNKESICVTDFGVMAGSSCSVTNCDNYAKLVSYVRGLGGFVNIVWPPNSEPYQFSPKDNVNFNTADNSWREAIELVDVERVYHYGAGAIVQLNADQSWIRGNSNTGAGATAKGMDESPIQFRASGEGLCKFVGVEHLKITTTPTLPDSSGLYSDGNTMGIAYRGCQNTRTINPDVSGWGTDGIYYGTAYGNGAGGKNHYIETPSINGNYRQGISVVGNSNGVIVGGEISDTYGSSFGYAIDFEPNVGRQEGWLIMGLKTSNNERGACNHIRSQNIKWVDCDFDETFNSMTNSGCIKIDGSQDLETLTNNIRFIRCKIKGRTATIYINGEFIDDVEFDDCELTCVGNVNVSAQIRINASSSANVGKFTIKNSRIKGNGGLDARGATGGLSTEVSFINNKWFPSDELSTEKKWNISTGSEFVYAKFIDNEIKFEDEWSGVGTVQPYIVEGVFKGNSVESKSGYLVEWRDHGAKRNVIIGSNSWGEYSYYKGVSTRLNIKSVTSAVQEPVQVSSDFSNQGRYVHGGRGRLIEYLASPLLFTGQQAPREGDRVLNSGGDTASTAQVSYTYSEPRGLWFLDSFMTFKGSTSARPNVILTGAYDTGLQYLDTSLSVNGVIVTWNSLAWVDGAGNIV